MLKIEQDKEGHLIDLLHGMSSISWSESSST